MVNVLLAAKADPNKCCKDQKLTPLHSATTAEVVDLLLDHGADPNAEDHRGDNAVSVAIFRGDFEVVHHLFERLPELKNQKDQYGRTPLIKAVASGNVEAANWLLEAGVEIDLPDARGETPLTYAVVKKEAELALKLIELGAKGDRKDAAGNTPLLWAQRYGLSDVVEKLTDAGLVSSA
ncbi:Ankyrin [Enhygromyxa salina]|uniref:Ankyrin n=2 Tax=Enhygromyxa salina TaxID=215803 RepID=A0A0C2CXC8_9BACT|nr:Ankyrin [Enhygromyxa salina]